ncbi:MAG: 2Fe-2S iron-sulfur cluster-binding protein [Bryobacterales bacterium]|nr:2Fe-2S iron-sulfur cluster-binding protein [Bryobacterales bacterium]
MPKVTFLPENVTVEFDPETMPYSEHGLKASVLDIALNNGLHLEHACGGNNACTTCHIKITEGMGNVSEMEDDEADRLDQAADLSLNSRLGCQCVVHGDIVLEIPSWNRNYVSEGGGSMNLGDAIPAPVRK